MAFKDYFSDNSHDYSHYRPQYPKHLFRYLASIAPDQQYAWDCATGTGQSAIALADYFSQIIATDASANQINNARTKHGIRYCVARAENSGIKTQSIDLISVAQALHWFNIDAFAAESNRVLKPQGILAVWTYNLLSIEKTIDEKIEYLYDTVLKPFWAPERLMVENSYQDVHFSLPEINPPVFTMTAHWNLGQLLGYLNTWSAVKEYQKKIGQNPLEFLYQEIAPLWGKAENKRLIQWPLSLRIWQKS
jgi:SAM-dependent methyltransferase